MTVTKAQVKSWLYWWNVHRPPNGYDQEGSAKGPDGNPYRTDCSGYVSMLTRMTNSPNTAAMMSDSISFAIGDNDLTFGDILIKPAPNGHVVMFESWANSSRTLYNAHDFGYGNEPHHRVLACPRDNNGRVTSWYPGTRVFQPRRLRAIQQDSRVPTSTKPKPPKSPQTNGVPPYPGQAKRGDTGPVVAAYQARLIARGWSSLGKKASGKFDAQTENVVRAFQSEKHLAVDGICGPRTWEALWSAAIT